MRKVANRISDNGKTKHKSTQIDIDDVVELKMNGKSYKVTLDGGEVKLTEII